MNEENEPKISDINCPFLKIARKSAGRDFRNVWDLASNCSREGLQYRLALVVGADILAKQQGFCPMLLGRALDLYALDQVPGVSHPDKYGRYMDETIEKLTAAKSPDDDTITLQDLVDVKKWIATEKENMTVDQITKPSKIETNLAFVGSGGNVDTGKTKLQDIISFLQGVRPGSMDTITTAKLGKADKMAKW